MNPPEPEKNEEGGGEDYWRKKCSSLQKQVEMLTVANKLLGQQVQMLAKSNCRNNNQRQNAEQNSFSILPEELWEIILEYLGESQDLLNVSRTCNQLDTVLHPGKGTWMFSFILKHIFKWLKRQDILNCRLVCKKWSTGIDEFLEKHPIRRPYSKDNLRPNDSFELVSLTNTFHLWDADRMRTIHEEITDHPRNPFVGRCVIFNVEIDEDFDDDEDEDFDYDGITEFWELTKLILSSVGHHIWYVDITEDSGHQKPFEFYKLLRELLIYLPSLKSLKLVCDISHQDYHPKALPLYMANNPLPIMPHLESLDVECFYPEVPQIIHDMFIAMYSTQLLKLHLNLSRWKNSYTRGLVKLVELHVKEISLERLSLLQAPNLEKLCLDLRDTTLSLASSSSGRFSIRRLLQVMSRFPTLCALKLVVDITVESEEIDDAARKVCFVPSLKQLEVDGIHRKINYSFVLCFPSLEFINFRETTSANKFNEDPAVVAFLEGDALNSHEEVVEIQKYMYTGRMYKSNIWKLITTLQVFSFQRVRYGNLVFQHQCTRSTHEYHRNRTETETLP